MAPVARILKPYGITIEWQNSLQTICLSDQYINKPTIAGENAREFAESQVKYFLGDNPQKQRYFNVSLLKYLNSYLEWSMLNNFQNIFRTGH